MTNTHDTKKSWTTAEQLAFLSEETGVPRNQVKAILEGISKIVAEHLQHGLPYTLNGLIKISAVEKPETPEREAKNPFTGKLTTFPKKPAHNAVRVKVLKKLKDLANLQD